MVFSNTTNQLDHFIRYAYNECMTPSQFPSPALDAIAAVIRGDVTRATIRARSRSRALLWARILSGSGLVAWAIGGNVSVMRRGVLAADVERSIANAMKAVA